MTHYVSRFVSIESPISKLVSPSALLSLQPFVIGLLHIHPFSSSKVLSWTKLHKVMPWTEEALFVISCILSQRTRLSLADAYFYSTIHKTKDGVLKWFTESIILRLRTGFLSYCHRFVICFYLLIVFHPYLRSTDHLCNSDHDSCWGYR